MTVDTSPVASPDLGPYRPFSVKTSGRGKSPCVVAPAGDLDLSSAKELEAALRAAESSGASRIVVDLSGVSFMDSAGLKVLLQAADRSPADPDRLRLIPGSRRVQRVFEVTSTEQLLPWTGEPSTPEAKP